MGPGPDRIFRLSRTLKDEGYIEFLDLESVRGDSAVLEHIVYRSLKLVYGNPDRLTVSSNFLDSNIEEIEDIDLRMIEWGYLLKLGGGFYIECKNGDCPFLTKFIILANLKENPLDMIANLHETIGEIITSKEGICFEDIVKHIGQLPPDEILKIDYHDKVEALRAFDSIKEMLDQFREFMNLLNDLYNIVDNNYSIDNESCLPVRLMANLYSEYLNYGDIILELAEEFSTKKNETEKGILHFGQLGKIINDMDLGTLFISATVYYLMALEGFINLLYKFLLKPDFEHEQYKRFIHETSVELKILHLCLYCRGFSSSMITPEDDAIKYWKQIRYFRNNLVHANLSKEHEWSVTSEDDCQFGYNILYHRKFSKNTKNHTHPYLFGKDDAIRVKSAVEGIVANIIEKMDEKEKGWVKSWIKNSLIAIEMPS